MNRREVKRAPVLRFKGFTNDWEQHTLGDFGSVAMNKRIFKNQTTDKGDVPFFKISTFGKKADSFISNNLFEKYKEKYPYPQKGDLLISASGSIGRIVEYKGQKAYYQDSNIVWLNHNKELLNIYLKAYYQIIHWHGIEGSTIKRLYNKNILATSIFVPDKKEQYELGKLIKKAEKIISLQQRKLELLKASKKAVLQNIFTDTKRVPTIRFNTFSENWNQKRLKPFLIKYNKKTTVNNQYPVLTSSRQGLFFQKDYYDGNQIASKNNIGYNIVPRNYFTYRHMSDDLIFHFNINTICDYGIVSTLYPVFTTTSEIDSQWLLYYLNHSVDIKKYALLQKQGGSRTYMYFSKLESLKAHIPALAEQKKISSLIFKIDEQIYFQQKKLKYLQKSKRFLLQNMFI